jgi:cyclopropane fatty-acyl-phospholipid synthase-like methyltransferase
VIERTPIERTLACYSKMPLPVRAHLWLRWHSCPFLAVAGHLPPSGRILDLGCGHGLLSLHLAISAPQRHVVGVELDDRKFAACESAASVAACPNLEFQLGRASAPPPGPWEAVCVVDMLYLLDTGQQQACISGAARELAPGGKLVVKEMAERPRWKSLWNRAQETVAVQLLKITAGGPLHLVGPAVIERWMVEAGLSVQHHRLDRGYPHPHHLVIGERL